MLYRFDWGGTAALIQVIGGFDMSEKAAQKTFTAAVTQTNKRTMN